jgi:hypothetical protein
MKTSFAAMMAFAVATSAVPMKHEPPSPFYFTSTYKIVATPDQVVDANNTITGGLEGALGYYNFGVNSYENTICYNITLVGFRGV